MVQLLRAFRYLASSIKKSELGGLFRHIEQTGRRWVGKDLRTFKRDIIDMMMSSIATRRYDFLSSKEKIKEFLDDILCEAAIEFSEYLNENM